MIARNLKAGKFSDGLINYAFEGKELEHKDKAAEVLRYSKDLLVPFSSKDAAGIAELKRDFNNRTKTYLTKNPDNKNALIGHQILSFTKEDAEKLKEKGMVQALDDYIKLANLEQTQYIAIKHNDTNNPHIHVIYHKVNNSLVKEQDWKLNNKTIERGVALALKNKLTLVKDQKKVALTAGVLAIRALDDDVKKLREGSSFLSVARNEHHLQKLLASKEIEKETLKDGRVKFDGKVYRQEDLQAVFYSNRNEEKLNDGSRKESKRQKSDQESTNHETSKKSTHNLFQAEESDEGLKAPSNLEQPFKIVTINSTERELASLRRKKRGKAHLLKNKASKTNTHTQGKSQKI